MDSNENRIVVIKSTLEQVKDGIEKVNGNASFILKIFKQDTEVRYWAVTAISNDYIIEIGYELECRSDRVDDYWFSIRKMIK